MPNLNEFFGLNWSPALVLTVGLAAVMLAIILVFTLFGILTSEKRQVTKSLSALQAYTTAPPELQREATPNFSERVTRPFLAWLTRVGRSFTPEDQARRLQHKLDVAGNPAGWNVDRIVGQKILGFIVTLVASIVVTMLLRMSIGWMLIICVAASVLGFMTPNMWVYQKGYDRMQLFRKDLPDSIDLLTISVEAGLGFDAALARVARDSEGPVASEFARVLQEINIGVSRVDALRNLGGRTQLPELKTFVTSLVQADAFGIPIAQVLRIQSKELRTKRRQRAEELAQKVPIKILFPLLFCILPTLLVVVLGPGVIIMAKSLFGMTG